MATWGAGRLVLTALTAAVSGNVTGTTGEMIESAAVNYIQGLATQQVKQIADSLDSETARTALQGLVGCAGAAAQGQGCTAGATGAAASVVLNDLFNSLNGVTGSSLTNQQKIDREQVIQSIVIGAAAALGGDAATVANSAQIETLNNAISTNKPNYAAQMLGYDRNTFGKMIHEMKDELGLRGDDNVIWHQNGDIEFNGNIIGNMHDYE